ncbi:MAG: ribulose-phosphate 3-epimerase [Acidobacteria bacterium]|nr:ribulose-phosphate 3-epimerase [Acidobacteriota bacterium]MCI0622517.1 ribulose-phosphate 3-epimerase [Acidobacteriota bacterium]MCI0723000.1 ribulose-phosphate 3-epimerase [Acidobacteriota bacterium]
MVQIAPSILAADFARLGEAIRLVETGGADVIHVDVMDGHFVPNITMGPPVVASIRKVTTLPLDVHLMIEDPDAYIQSFVDAGADWISVHIETCPHLDRTLQLIQSLGAKPGVVLNPATSLRTLDEALRLVDYVLIMTVNPGFGAQRFRPYTLEKIQRLRKVIQHKGLSARIEVDGGVSLENVPDLVGNGAEILVAGTQIFGDPDPAAAVRKMKALAEQCAVDRQTIA